MLEDIQEEFAEGSLDLLGQWRRHHRHYESIRQTVRQSDWVVPDETGWRVGGHPAWLHALVSPQATAYVIDPTRSGDVPEDILGLD